MTKWYKHTQIGYLVLITVGSAMLLIAYLMSVCGFNWIPFAALIVLGICLGLFGTLTIEIDDRNLEIRFGIGIVRKRFPLEEIESCRVVKNPWYYGWGIRLTPHGLLYNVSGLFAVELQLKGDRKYRIGTDEPEKLRTAIQERPGR